MAYSSLDLRVNDVLHAGTPKFNAFIDRIGGKVAIIPDKVVHDIRTNGVYTFSASSKKWTPITYKDSKGNQKHKLLQSTTDWNMNPPESARESWTWLQRYLKMIVCSIIGIDPTTINDDDFETILSKLGSGSTVPQPPHLDWVLSILDKLKEDEHLYFAVFPLSPDGMVLQLWENGVPGKGQLVYLPAGAVLVLRGDTVHGGGFMTSPAGNLRAHIYLYVKRRALQHRDNDVYYRINKDSIYKPADCLVQKKLVKDFGAYEGKGKSRKFCWAVYYD